MKKIIYIQALFTGVLLAGMPVHAQHVKISTEESTETEEGRRAKADEAFFEAIKAKIHEDYPLAEKLLKQFLEDRPESAAANFELAMLYDKKKEAGFALVRIDKAIELDPSNKWYKETKGGILANSGRYAEAADMFAQLSQSEIRDPDYPTQAAELYERAGNTTEALKYINIAIARSLDDEELMLNKMQLFVSLKEIDKAADVINALIAKEPKNGKYYKLLGELYDNNNLPAKAQIVYDDAKQKLPNDPSVQLGLAGHYYRTGDTAQYKLYVRQAITNNGVASDAQLDLLKAYVQSLPSEAEAIGEALPLVRRLVAQEPKNSLILDYYGEALEVNGMKDSAVLIYKRSLAVNPANFNTWGRLLANYLDEAYTDSLIKYSEKAMRLFPNQAVTHYYNGIGYMYRKDYSSAIKAINRAIDLQPENEKAVLAQMYGTLADVYNSDKKYELSDKSYDEALALDPDNGFMLNNYSYYLSERGEKLDDAERMSARSLEIGPDDPNSLDTYGWILYKKGDNQKARTYIQKAIDAAKGIDDGTYYNHMGNILFKLNKKDEAIASWKKAKEKGCDDKNIDKKIRDGKLYE